MDLRLIVGIMNLFILKKGEYYPIFKKSTGTLHMQGAGGIITHANTEITTYYGSIIYDNNKLLLDEDNVLVKNNGKYLDCYGNVITSKILFVDNYDRPFIHTTPRFVYKSPITRPPDGAKLEEKKPPKVELYYAANLTELVEKYFPQAIDAL